MELSLASEKEIEIPNNDYIAELKYDGNRMTIHTGENIVLKSRNGNRKNNNFPEITELEPRLPDNTILDGEIIVKTDKNPIMGEFDKANKRALTENEFKQKLYRKKISATYIVFDILKYKGKDLTDKEYLERRRILEEELNTENNHIELSEKWENLEDAITFAEKNDLEGIIFKKTDGKYIEGRNTNWIKFKTFKRQEVTVNQYEEHSKGIRVTTTNGISLTVNGKQSQTVKNMIENTGEAEIEIQYLEKLESGELRQPTFKGIA